MALNSTVVWRVRALGSASNGGGFDPAVSGAGTDYSDSDGQFVGFSTAGGSAHATTSGVSATLSITNYTVNGNEVGNILQIRSGTNFTIGFYCIVSVNTGANTWTLDRNCCTAAASSMVGGMGGAFARINSLATAGSGPLPSVTSPLAAGHTIMVRGSGSLDGTFDYDQTDGYLQFPGGDTTKGVISLIGYNGRPCFKGDLMFYNIAMWRFEHVKLLLNAVGIATTYGMIFTGGDVSIADCIVEQNGIDAPFMLTPARFMRSTFKNTGSTAAGTYRCMDFTSIGIGVVIAVENCTIDSWRGGGIRAATCGNVGILSTTISNTKANQGYEFSGGSAGYSTRVIGCTFSGNAGDGVRFSGQKEDFTQSVVIENTSIGNGGYGFNAIFGGPADINSKCFTTRLDYNDTSGNTSGSYNGLLAGSNPRPAVATGGGLPAIGFAN